MIDLQYFIVTFFFKLKRYTSYFVLFCVVGSFFFHDDMIVLLLRSPVAQSLWEAMLTSKHKEGVMEVRRHLVEAASKEKLPIKMTMGMKQNDICLEKHKPVRNKCYV